MQYFAQILKAFNMQQRIFVLILLLMFTCGTYIFTTYLKSDYNSCSSLIIENKKLMTDFITISDLIRKERISSQFDSVVVQTEQPEKNEEHKDNAFKAPVPYPTMTKPSSQKTSKKKKIALKSAILDSIISITNTHLKL